MGTQFSNGGKNYTQRLSIYSRLCKHCLHDSRHYAKGRASRLWWHIRSSGEFRSHDCIRYSFQTYVGRWPSYFTGFLPGVIRDGQCSWTILFTQIFAALFWTTPWQLYSGRCSQRVRQPQQKARMPTSETEDAGSLLAVLVLRQQLPCGGLRNQSGQIRRRNIQSMCCPRPLALLHCMSTSVRATSGIRRQGDAKSRANVQYMLDFPIFWIFRRRCSRMQPMYFAYIF